MTRVTQPTTPKLAGKPLTTNANPFDGKVTFTGFHGRLSPAKPDSIANVLLTQRPPFSAQATNVKHHANGVTSYDITKVGPPFAYQPVGATTFEVNGKKFAFVADKKAIPGLTPELRTGLMKALREAQGK